MTNTDPTLTQLITETATALGMDNPSEQVLLEFTSLPSTTTTSDQFTFQQSRITNTKDGLTRISGVFIHNDPARFEPGALADAVTAYQSQIHSRQALGALRGANFKASPVVDPATAAIVIERLELDDKGNAVGVAAVCSKKLEALLRVGWIPAVMMVRGLGRTNAQGQTRKGFRLTALDVGWTGTASNVTATSTGGTVVNESLNEQVETPPTPTPSAGKAKPKLISPEMLAESIDRKKSSNARMAAWIASVRNNTDFK